jgi:hypothetical protein
VSEAVLLYSYLPCITHNSLTSELFAQLSVLQHNTVCGSGNS